MVEIGFEVRPTLAQWHFDALTEMLVRSIGLVRAKAVLGLKNLTYNFMCYTFYRLKVLARAEN